MDGTARTVKTGGFFLPGDAQDPTTQPWQLGPAWVHWEAPAAGSTALPLVFVHGGGGQSTDWLGVSAAAPGWAIQAVQAGFPVYLLDRPGHGRSPYDPARLGERTPFPAYAGASAVFAPVAAEGTDVSNPAWRWGREPGSPQLDALVASSSGMLTDTALGQELDARRLVDLLKLIGPCVVITHSAGAAAGWLGASRVPELVQAVIAVEPIGPPFRDLGARGSLEYGATAVPLDGERLDGVPVLVVSGDSSGRAEADMETTGFLREKGAAATHLQLGNEGIAGNGHGLIFEANNHEIFAKVLDWLEGLQPDHHGSPQRQQDQQIINLEGQKC
ncbi:lysophospholipase [Arthrobacter sp. 7749]|nr:lysophospholipase [Arthrobacter sp. 7749]